MQKSFYTSATVISVKPSGKNNSTVTFLTKKEGILHATMYGGAKSKIKSLVSAWNTGTAYFSAGNTGFYKISDFDVKTYRLTFRENLLKYWAASLAVEIAIKTKCAANNEKCWNLINGFLNGLELCTNDEQCTLGLIRFLWRYLDLLGIQPDTEKCQRCSEKITNGASFSTLENGFLCSDCSSKDSVFKITQNGLEYLSSVSKLSPLEVRKIPFFSESVPGVKQIIYYLIQNACGTELKTLKLSGSMLL